MYKTLYVLTFLLPSFLLCGRVWEVGPAKQFTLPSQVAPLVADGDTVYFDPGIYQNDACRWTKNNLKLIGLGSGEDRPRMKYSGNIPNGKGIWVFDSPGHSDNIHIAGIIFDGAQVSDNDGGNGAGIRFQANNLTIENCLFKNCQNGILEGHGAVTTSNVIIKDSEFYNNGYSGYEHHIYINASADTLLVQNCFFHHPRGQANSLKTRAQNAFILYNYIDEEDGDGSYEINIAQGGNNVIMGNVIIQGPAGSNHAIVGYDDATNPQENFYFINNTVVNKYSGNNRYFHISPDNGIHVFKVWNNVFASIPSAGNQFITGNVPEVLDTSANYFTGDYHTAGFTDPDQGDFSLTPDAAALIDRGADAGLDANGFELLPRYMYLSASGDLQVRQVSGSGIDIGAYEYLFTSGTRRTTGQLSISPNPSSGRFEITVPASYAGRLAITDMSGRPVAFEQRMAAGDKIRCDMSGIRPGSYIVRLDGDNKTYSGRLIIIP